MLQKAFAPDNTQAPTASAGAKTLSDSGLIKLGKRLAPQKTAEAAVPTKRAKRESDDQSVPKLMSITNLETPEDVEEHKLNEKPRSQDNQGSKKAGLIDAEVKNEKTETDKSDLFNRELGDDDDDDSEKRRERR